MGIATKGNIEYTRNRSKLLPKIGRLNMDKRVKEFLNMKEHRKEYHHKLLMFIIGGNISRVSAKKKRQNTGNGGEYIWTTNYNSWSKVNALNDNSNLKEKETLT